MLPPPDPRFELRLRAALLAAIRHAMETTCGYSPAESELEEAVQAGLACLSQPPGPAPPG